MLKSEHAEVKKLLAALVAATTKAPARRTQLLTEVGLAVRSHSRIEEVVFYPAYAEAAKNADDRSLNAEAREEHHVVDIVLAELEKTDPATDEFSGKAKVLKDLIEHHAGEEEREMFPRMQKLLSAEELQRLGEEMHELEGEEATAPASRTRRVSPRVGQKSTADRYTNTMRVAAVGK